MNDATELESSLDGAIGFFQNLRRKLGTLEAETSAQQDRLYAIAASVATLQQDWQADHQSLAGLAGDSHAQAGQLAELIAGFQQDQQHLQQTLATLAADLRQEWQAALEQRAAPTAQIEALEQQISGQAREMHSLLLSIQALSHDARTTRDGVKALESQIGQHDSHLEQLAHTVKSNQERLEQLGASAETQSQCLQRLESALDTLSQATETGAEAVREQIEEQQTRFDDLTGSLATVWQDAQTLQETVREQFEEQQARFDDLTGSLATLWQDAQTLQEEVGRLSGEFEAQRHAGVDAGQIRQDLQKQQERLKHLETLMGKVSADTNSTRQILNVLQTDLTNQSDLLRELDQNWRDTLAAVQDHPGSAATLIAAPPPPAAAPAQLADDLAASRRDHENFQQELSTVQVALTRQDERLTELHTALQDKLQRQQERLGELETSLIHLQQTPAQESTAESATAADLADLHETLAAQTGALHDLQQSLQQQLQRQQERLGELETTLTHLQQTPAQESTAESATAADLADLHETLAAQTGALNDLREVTHQRFGTLENQWLDFQHAADSLGELHQETQDLRQQLARLDAAITQQQQAAAGDPHAQELHHNLETLQQTLVDLESRMAGQAQAFSGNFEQFRGLRSDIQSLQHDLAALESLPGQLHTLDQNLSAQDRQIIQLKQTVQHLQQEAQQLGEAIQTRAGSSTEDLEARLNEQREQMDSLTATLETVQSDARLTQEKVVTMATNVAKRIFEFQNQLAASETAQTERLQEAEQKLIQLQAALEILQAPHKSRSWFKMPATLATVVLTVGTAFLGILAKVIWTIG
ncbi:MAG: hypothetical protein JNK95_14030 [Candidatus Competibacter sp.]|nr:hypothetical protein [Candidatus Competibacter sp.]